MKTHGARGGLMARARWATMMVGVGVSALGLSPSPARAVDAQVPGGYELVAQWGGLGSGQGQFDHPFGVAVDDEGNVYVSDSSNQRIQKFDSVGTFLAEWGSFGSGDGQLAYPRGIAVDANGNVYVGNADNARIEKFDSNGTFLTHWGTFGDGDGQIHYPWGVAVDAAGQVYVADGYYADRIDKFDSDGTFLTRWGSYGTGDGQFSTPYGLGVDGGGNVYVADTFNNRIQKFDSNGAFLTQWGSGGLGEGHFNHPFAVAVDAHGDVYVADGFNSRIQKFDSNGAFLTMWGGPGSGDGQFNAPYGLAVDTAGNVYVADTFNHRVQKFAPVATDSTAPEIEITTPADGAAYELGQSVQVQYSCSDEPGGSGLKSCTGDLANGADLDTATVGDKSFTVTAEDNAGNLATETIHYRVVYDFAGFFSPVENLDAGGQYVLNKARPGSGIPIKFSLDGDQGLAIFASGYPKSEVIACDPTAEVEAIDQTVTAGGSALSYDPITGQYRYVWKTDKTWRGCRQLVVKLTDGTIHRASFSFAP